MPKTYFLTIRKCLKLVVARLTERIQLLVWVAIAGACILPSHAQKVSYDLSLEAGVDPFLHSLIKDALLISPELKAAGSLQESGRHQLRAAKMGWLPSLSVDAFATAMDDQNDPTLTIDQPLWTGGRIKADIERSKSAISSANAGYEEAVYNLISQVSEQYYFGVSAAARIETLERSLKRHKELVEMIGRRAETGVSPETDMRLAESRAGLLETDISLAQMELDTALLNLSELTGREAHSIILDIDTLKVDLFELDTDILDQALACSPTLKRLRAEAKVASSDADRIKAEIYPELSLRYSHTDRLGDEVGLSLRASTNAGFSSAARASAAREQANARYAEIATTQRQIRQSVLQALVQHQTSFTRISQTEQAAKSSEDVKSSYERQYVAGRRTWLDLMNAVRELSNAELNAVSAKTTALSAASKLRLQTCQWASFQTDQQK